MAKKRVAVEERTLPSDLAAEKAILGSCLINPAAFDRAGLQGRHFYRHAHRLIWDSMRELNERGTGIDLLTLKAQLTKHAHLDEAGGPAYLAMLTDGIPRSSNVAHYAGIVRDLANLRGVIGAANAMLDDAYLAELPATEIVASADRAIIELQRGADVGALSDVRQAPDRLYPFLEDRVKHRGQVTGITSGFASIDELTLGWQGGDLIVVGARPSIGKSVWAMNVAVAAASGQKVVAVFSLEMSREQLETRLLAQLSQVHIGRIRGGHIDEADWPRLSDAMGKLGELPLFIDDGSGRNFWEIRAACRRLRAEQGLDLVIVDYVQLMPGTLDQRTATRTAEITDISRRLKVLAGELRVPIILLSQLNRGADGRGDSRPRLQDLRESGSLEQDADLVCFLHRRHHLEDGTTNFIIEKARNGPGGTVDLSIWRDLQTFTDGPTAVPEPTPVEGEAPEKRKRPRKFWSRAK